MRSSMHDFGEILAVLAALVGFRGVGKVLRVLSEEEEVSE